MINLNKIIKLKNEVILAGLLSLIVLFETSIPQPVIAQSETPSANTINLVANGHLTICKLNKESYEVVRTIKMVLTAYNSLPEQTDDTPFITASGKHVADGIIANNLLPFGTKVRIPSLYGDKVFVVEDRMHSNKSKYHVDVWMPDYSQAKNFGAKITDIQIIES